MLKVGVPNFKALTYDIEGDIAGANTRAMKRAAAVLKDELRDQVKAAGMSQRLANTWRDQVYPKGRRSLTPAGYVWSNAPAIVDSYARGVTIRPLGAKKFLWIPTKAVPREGSRGKRAMSPTDVEVLFNQDLIIRNGKRRTKLAFVRAVRAKNGRGFRQATAGRARQGRAAELTLMFVLVPFVVKPKLFDLDAAAEQAADRFVTYLGEELASV